MAALEVAGLVDACATSDGDALVFGASHIYHTLRLQVCRRMHQHHMGTALRRQQTARQTLLRPAAGMAEQRAFCMAKPLSGS